MQDEKAADTRGTTQPADTMTLKVKASKHEPLVTAEHLPQESPVPDPAPTDTIPMQDNKVLDGGTADTNEAAKPADTKPLQKSPLLTGTAKTADTVPDDDAADTNGTISLKVDLEMHGTLAN